MPQIYCSYWVKYSLPDPCLLLPRTAGTHEICFSLRDLKTYASKGYKATDADHIALLDIDIFLEKVHKAIAQVPRGIMVELHVDYPISVAVEYSTLDFLVEKLLFIPGWHHLKMSFPGMRPMHLGERERGTEGDFLTRNGGKSRLIAALAGKRISFRGSRAEVPAPWYSLRALTRYGVASLDLNCKITPKDWYDLCYSSALDNTPRYPLELTVDAIDRGGDAQQHVNQPHQGDEWPTHARPSLDNLLHPDNGACRVRKGTVRADGLTWTYPWVGRTDNI